MTTLTLTTDADLGRVRVAVTDAQGGDLTRNGELVRGGAAVTGWRIVDDYEPPFGVPVTYSLDGVQATTQLDVAQAWLSHPTDPTLRMAVTVQSDDDWQWSAPGTAHDVLGDVWPIVTWAARTVHTGQLVVITSYAERDAFKALLLAGSPLLLRTPPDCPVDDQWLWPRTATRSKIGTPSVFTGLRWELEYQRVQAPGGLVAQDPTNSWAAVVVTHPTWSDVLADHATWGDLLITPHPHA